MFWIESNTYKNSWNAKNAITANSRIGQNLRRKESKKRNDIIGCSRSEC